MKVKFKKSEMEAFMNSIDFAIELYQEDIEREGYSDVLCLAKAVLEDMQLKCKKQWLIAQPKYTLEIKPHHGFAIRAAFAGNPSETYAGNMMRQLCDRIHQQIATKILSH